MSTMMDNGPPVAIYEQVVHPVEGVQRIRALQGHERHGRKEERPPGKRKEEVKGEEREILFEPMLGKLFDYSA